MLKFIALLVSIVWFLSGLYGLYGHQQWLTNMEASYTEHAGRVADTRFHFKMDHNEVFGQQYHSVTFQLEGEPWEYSLIIPPGSRLVREKLLQAGHEVELGYVDPGITPPKRRVWYLTQKDQPPLLTADVARAHADEKNQSVSYGMVFLGFASLVASAYWLSR